MTTFKLFNIAVIIVCLLAKTAPIINAQVPNKANKEIVKGGQFKDLILPTPIFDKLTSKNIWGAENVLPRDVNNGVEDNEWSYWGGNPMKGNDGKYHIAICRWREETGHWGWPKSEVAHAVSKQPAGPYKVTGTVLAKAHNPEVIKLNNGTYVLHVSGGNFYTAKELDEPWNLLGKIKIDTRGHKGLSHLNTNLTGVERKDGSFLFFTKRGDVMISNTGILGTYKMVSVHNYLRYSGYPEDPVIWKSLHQYHAIYNHAVDKKSVYMRSLDGITWGIEPGAAYDKSIFEYPDGTKNEWCKFERPKVMQDELGRATHLSLAVMDVEKHLDLGNDNFSSKNTIMPLVVEKIVEIINAEPITSETEVLTVRIKKEKGFNPIKDVDISTLKLGTSNVINYGGGASSIHSKADNGDLIVSFNWKGTTISSNNYDLKLLGKTTKGKMLFAYALLPSYQDNPAALASLPISFKEENGSKTLVSAVENWGLKSSDPCKAMLVKSSEQKREILKEFDVPTLKPYEDFKLEVPVNTVGNAEFEVLILDSKKELNVWRKVDETHYTVVYNGDWITNEKGNDIYMNAEQVSHQKNASATFFFSGTQARCFGHISRDMGAFDVYIDDTFIEKVQCYFGADIHNSVIYQTEVLPDGLHKLELRIRGEHYKGKNKGPVAVDAFSYR